LFGISRTEASVEALFFVVFETMPFCIIALDENKTVAVTAFDEAGSFDGRGADDAGLQVGILYVVLKNIPNLIDLFAKGGLVID
jgi:hypothetical protein